VYFDSQERVNRSDRFSYGAGYYGVEWVAFGQGCTRTILTNDEKILFEYMAQ